MTRRNIARTYRLLPLFALSALALLTGLAASADFQSPLPSTIPGVTIRNAHILARGPGTLVRGQGPLGKIDELKRLGITDVLIFKNQFQNEVTEEVNALLASGLPADRIYRIPFRWKNMPAFQESCQETLNGLRFLHQAFVTPGRSLFFHCTLGEDRTGHLSGLFRIVEEGWDHRRAFQEEMCENGYEAGDATKPPKIVDSVRRELTPVFLKMAYLLQKAKQFRHPFNGSLCSPEKDAEATRALEQDPRFRVKDFVCRPSSKMPPRR